jgi:thiol:disulfide interchange protein
MAGLLFFLGLSLAGQFEIGLTLTSAGGSLAQKQGYSGSFFTGVLAVVVATPCTAPFMGAAIGYALAQSPVVTFAVFTALALGAGRALCGADAAAGVDALLPKPGAWMEVLRQAVAVPIFATVIWLAWSLTQRVRRWSAGGRCWQPSAAGDCGMVSGALAGKALGNGGCGADRCWR